MSADVIEVKPPQTVPTRDILEYSAWKGRRVMVTLHVPNFCFHDQTTETLLFTSLTISYSPGARLLDEQSLSYYVNQFVNVRTTLANIVDKVADDIGLAVEPAYIAVSASGNAAGGISVEVRAERTAEKK